MRQFVAGRRAIRIFSLVAIATLGCIEVNSSSKSPSTSGTSTYEVTKPSAPGDVTAKVITVEGSSTVYPLCQTLAVKFEKDTKYKLSVSGNGTGGGYKKFVIRQADIWNASRPIAESEIKELKEKGIGWVEFQVAIDGIVIAVNTQNDWCPQLSCAQLKRIWEPDSKVKTWSDIDPAWPVEEIQLYGADVDSGTFEYFTEVINEQKKAINTRYTPSANDNVLVQGISSNKYALGFIPFTYYVENTEKVKAVAVSPSKDATEAPGVLPTVETVVSGEYTPLARPLFMYVNKEALSSRPELAAFLRFVVSPEAQPMIEKRGFVRVKENVREEMAKKLEQSLSDPSVTKN